MKNPFLEKEENPFLRIGKEAVRATPIVNEILSLTGQLTPEEEAGRKVAHKAAITVAAPMYSLLDSIVNAGVATAKNRDPLKAAVGLDEQSALKYLLPAFIKDKPVSLPPMGGVPQVASDVMRGENPFQQKATVGQIAGVAEEFAKMLASGRVRNLTHKTIKTVTPGQKVDITPEEAINELVRGKPIAPEKSKILRELVTGEKKQALKSGYQKRTPDIVTKTEVERPWFTAAKDIAKTEIKGSGSSRAFNKVYDKKGFLRINQEKKDIIGYEIIDTHTGEVVSGKYKVKDRGRARRRADNLDLDYGAHRYNAQPIFEQRKPLVQRLKDESGFARIGKEPDMLTPSKQRIKSEIEKANVGRNITDAEKKAQEYVLNNTQEALDEYTNKVRETYPTNIPNIISADVGKFVIPDMSPEKSIDYHEPGFALSKAVEDILLKTSTSDKALFMAGVSGGGKSKALRTTNRNLNEYAIVYDTNFANYESSKRKIDKVINAGKKVNIVYVYRDPIVAYENGVIPRIKKEGRIVPIDVHIKNYMGSFPTVQKIANEYGNKVDVEIIDNSRGKDEARMVPLENFKPKEYTYNELESKLVKVAQQALEEGKINEQVYQVATANLRGISNRGRTPDTRGQEARPGQRISTQSETRQVLRSDQSKENFLKDDSGFLSIGGGGKKPPRPQKAPPASGESFPERFKGSFENAYQTVFNRLASIENAVKLAEKRGAKIPVGENPFLQSRLYAGIERSIDAFLRFNTFTINDKGQVVKTGDGLKPILDRWDKHGTEQELKDYLKAKRYIEDLKPRDMATDEQVAESEAVLERLQGKEKELEKTAQEIYDFQKRALQELTKSGLISQEQEDAILKQNPHYIPFDRVMEEESFEGLPRSRGRFTRVKAPIEKIKGSEREVEDVLESVIKNTYRILDRASRNRVTRNLATLADVVPEMIRAVPEAPKKYGVTYRDNGEVKHLEVSPNLYDALTGIKEQAAGLFVKIMSYPATTLRWGATSTPEFMLRNFIRDQFVGTIQSKVGFRPFIDTVGAMADIMGKSDAYIEWLQSGGAYSGFVELSRPKLRKMYKGLRNRGINIKEIFFLPQHFSMLIEQATRLGIYKAGKRKGLPSMKSGYASREGTLDFNRKGGSFMQNWNRLDAFLNAGVQAFDKFFRTFKNDPIGATAKNILWITIPSVLLYLANKDDERHKELPRWQKDLFWMFHADRVGLPGDWFIRIPKPFAYGQVFGSSVERFLEYLDEKDPKALDGIVEALYASLAPVPGDPASIATITAVEPILENKVNYDFFFQRPIFSRWKEGLLPSEQYNKNTSRLAKEIGKKLNYSPAKIENLVYGYFSTSGGYGLKGSDKLIRLYEKAKGMSPKPKKPQTISDIFGVKGFVSESHRESPESVTQFYDLKREIDAAHGTYKKQLREQRFSEADKTLEKYPALNLKKQFDKYNRLMKKTSERIDMVVENKKLTDKQKQNQIEKLERERLKFAQEAKKLYEQEKILTSNPFLKTG